jgi:hypothetical protein
VCYRKSKRSENHSVIQFYTLYIIITHIVGNFQKMFFHNVWLTLNSWFCLKHLWSSVISHADN